MNIFYLDPDPEICARYHCDNHTNKMTVELAQMLCTAHYEFGYYQYPPMYKPAYINNSVSIWVRSSFVNYGYSFCLFLCLCKEFERRFNHKHECEGLIKLLSTIPQNIKETPFTPPTLAMPDCYKSSDPVSSYRAYYVGEKNQFANWRNGAPFWWPKDLKGYVNHVKYARAELQRCLSSGGNFGEVSETVRRSYDETIGQSCQEIG